MSPRNIRQQILDIPSSQIREVAMLGEGDPDVVALWYGESDEPTPDFIKQAASEALAADKTFYAPNSGIPALREAIATYTADLYDIDVDLDRITVTASGMQAIMLAMQALVDPGDGVVIVGPVWPNVRETVHVMGGVTQEVALIERNGRWMLDLDRLFAACTERTRAIFINSPSNPTGWMMEREEQIAVLEFCRARGIWLITDDVYARIVYDRPHAPSFLEIAAPEDRVVAVNSFSKSWSMTGWRLGWIIAPAPLLPVFAKLNEYNIAGPTTFVQHAGIVAIRDGEAYIEGLVERLRRRRDVVTERLGAFRRVRTAAPTASFYAFFAVQGMDESLAYAKQIVRTAKVGLAPGTAFGAAGEGYLRLCFASSDEALGRALDRLAPLLDGAP